jgi:hypothetical protein
MKREFILTVEILALASLARLTYGSACKPAPVRPIPISGTHTVLAGVFSVAISSL